MPHGEPEKVMEISEIKNCIIGKLSNIILLIADKIKVNITQSPIEAAKEPWFIDK